MARTLFFSFFFFAVAAQGQKLKKEDKQLLSNLKTHVTFLASDALEGRRTGTKGEQLAAEYIKTFFAQNGASPKGTEGFFQPFEVSEGSQINAGTHLTINDNNLALHTDFFPLSFSANASIEGMPSPALQETGMPWFIDIKEMLQENISNPHYDAGEAIKNKAVQIESRGATALFIYNTSAAEDGLVFRGKEGAAPVGIPVVYITKQAAAKYLNDESASLDIKLKTDIGPKTRKGINVVGYIDNGAASTIVLGAHYDHLGWGEDGNSMQRGVHQIHNGADDNASGTAALMELVRLIKASKRVQNNYLFIAFSGEELGLYGSKHWVENPTINFNAINYMINMDMVGRLNDSVKTITVGGFGTSPVWAQAYGTKGKGALYSTNLSFKFDSSGSGPSDHTSFYRKNVPVLFYFTGLHTDYHKPTDDHEKINYTGEASIVKHILSLIEHTDKTGKKAPFTKTKEQQTTTSARFSVSLGIMPDYTFSGAGVRADAVIENRAAEKAGLKAGDVITALGDSKVTSVESYMQALSKFKKGDKTTVSFSRGSEDSSATVEF